VITGLSHLAIIASDYDRSLTFYRDVLGLEEAFRVDNDDGSPWMVYFRTGPTDFIEIFAGGEGGDGSTSGRTIGIAHLCFWVDDLEQTAADLKSRGLDVDAASIRTGRSGCRQLFISDPDGVRIELMQMLPDSMQAKALSKPFKTV
jgi:lactoylglutathione lyase